MVEVWKDIKGYEGFYQVSNLGRVKTLERQMPFNIDKSKNIIKKEKILKPGKKGIKRNYLSVVLRKNSKQKLGAVKENLKQQGDIYGNTKGVITNANITNQEKMV